MIISATKQADGPGEKPAPETKVSLTLTILTWVYERWQVASVLLVG